MNACGTKIAQLKQLGDLINLNTGDFMYGTLKKTVDFNEMKLSRGASVYIDLAQAQMYDQMDPGESLSVSVALKYFTVRANIQKSNIQLAD